ncbi:uncharacterized protein NECHADRAFT_55197 [Fusarium vanettenii 77-13-4]|uniref:Xaa-Pro dipeptidyl-peptidase-like domain-containing protein n=1 Tax=Fusarium vanettenii (strain ATCC MYA-4622 / CBS 123669 / FGSC 9596 / NRRL 45880 / 77-13-4) TaxID=660122 RepID=C7ZQW9_FUSV7|nr:uncharacterized protein NECHADRAFT_55197 [Fusarium vanettenii 77-13-4]EEU33581.1 hypothetical protein NECHADRAFT_55197 [Fusarium vanettenii 77-13-4]
MRRLLPTDVPRARCTELKQQSVILKKGTTRREVTKPFSSGILFARDVPVTLPDGIPIYTDVFSTRGGPMSSNGGSLESIPEVGGQSLDDLTSRSNVPLSHVSELQKFEAPDLAYWVCQGYAVLNPDARGAYEFNGNITNWGRQLAEDGCDIIEWATAKPWSSGRTGMTGNLFLAISQWHVTASNPPCLAAIAPWEGATDILRAAATSLSIGNLGFKEAIITTLLGNNSVEDSPRMYLNGKFYDKYQKNRTPQ